MTMPNIWNLEYIYLIATGSMIIRAHQMLAWKRKMGLRDSIADKRQYNSHMHHEPDTQLLKYNSREMTKASRSKQVF